ncbi:hypothetical protein [Taklimakanibacter lacteus]|uniref:hypothetical protein n=1 Tax=Taklimakanibacter lacteus TaxID=2268456 RepID=UPI000E66B97F
MCWPAGLLLACLPVAESAFAYGLDQEPIAQVWVSPKSIGTIKSCIVKALDDSRRTYSKISPSVRHVAKIVAPNSVDIRPVKEQALVDVNYHVRLEKIHEQITRIALYSSDPGAKEQSPGSDPKKKPSISTGRDVAQAVASCSPPR